MSFELKKRTFCAFCDAPTNYAEKVDKLNARIEALREALDTIGLCYPDSFCNGYDKCGCDTRTAEKALKEDDKAKGAE